MRIGIWTGIFVLMAINKVLMNASEESVALGNIGFILVKVIIIRVFYSCVSSFQAWRIIWK